MGSSSFTSEMLSMRGAGLPLFFLVRSNVGVYGLGGRGRFREGVWGSVLLVGLVVSILFPPSPFPNPFIQPNPRTHRTSKAKGMTFLLSIGSSFMGIMGWE